jgi:thiol-disulfide isomerase/thioredoxin
MKSRIFTLLCCLTLPAAGISLAAPPQSPTGAAPAKSAPAPKKTAPAQATPKAKSAPAPAEAPAAAPDADAELQATVQQAGQDPVALAKNLEAYLVKYPDTPRRAAIYRALIQTEMQQQHQKQALDYAEKIIAIQPDDSQSMYLAASILETMPDDTSQLRAIDYDTRLIERVGKADPESRPQQMTLEDWQSGRIKFTMNLYVLRGRMQRNLHKNDDAVKDFTEGFRLLPNSAAAVNLGEIAEEQKHADEAIRQYAAAFMMAGQDPEDNSVTRDTLRLKMGNLWHFTHDSNSGLGDIWLSAFDKNKTLSASEKLDAVAYNKDVTDPLQFSMRPVDSKASAVKLADSHGKIVVLNFWTTWCAYCRTMQPMLAGVREKFAGRDDVLFLAVNADEEQAGVGAFLQTQKVDGTLLFADGVDHALHVESIPTVIVLDRAGKVAYRTQGFAPDNFADAVSAAIAKSSSAPAQ